MFSWQLKIPTWNRFELDLMISIMPVAVREQCNNSHFLTMHVVKAIYISFQIWFYKSFHRLPFRVWDWNGSTDYFSDRFTDYFYRSLYRSTRITPAWCARWIKFIEFCQVSPIRLMVARWESGRCCTEYRILRFRKGRSPFTFIH